ncbi:hypothetical protein M0802_006376 [Mischocyttarus mexicanus]|nr:hypothetical protein M0802_006376 [Mischocyttarus mexicanus]
MHVRIVSRVLEEKEIGRKRRTTAAGGRSVEETSLGYSSLSGLSLDILKEATTDKDTARVTNSQQSCPPEKPSVKSHPSS